MFNENRRKIIAVDFDGTLCEDQYPEIGKPNYNMIEYLQEEQKNNKAILILWTCRTYSEDLDEAITWCENHGLKIDYINENTLEQIQRFGNDSRKIFADEYIDDRNKSYYQDISLLTNDGDFAEFGVRVFENYLDYKGYKGTIEYEPEDQMYFGTIVEDPYRRAFKDLVEYDAETIRGLKQDFAEAVDDYIDFCKEVGKII